MLTKLKYAGLSRPNLLYAYALHIGLSIDYCFVNWHNNFTKSQSDAYEKLQKVSLNIILANEIPRLQDGKFDYKRP